MSVIEDLFILIINRRDTYPKETIDRVFTDPLGIMSSCRRLVDKW